MNKRLITPSQLSLFSISPVVGAWWDELSAQGLFKEAKPEPTALEQQLKADGIRHEELLVEKLKQEGYKVLSLQNDQSDRDYTATQEAMASGADYIHQASLCNSEMCGRADLLKRVEKPSLLGEWSYIPVECKLASKPKTTFLIQALAYCELLSPLLGECPDQFELYLGGGEFKTFNSKDFFAWYQHQRDRYREFRNNFKPDSPPIDEPGDHGHWTDFIQQRLEDQRDLILVADIRRSQREKLRAEGITTIDALAALPEETTIAKLAPDTFQRLREQAQVQLLAKDAQGRPGFRVKPVIDGRGLTQLPTADPGDIWFDMEGFHDPVTGIKLEYLFGACYRAKEIGDLAFKPWWAHSPQEEKRAFEEWESWAAGRLSVNSLP